MMKKQLWKVLVIKDMTCRKISAILGSLRSFLPAMPILRSFTDNMLNFIQRVRQLGWDHQVPIPQDLKQEVRDLNVITLGWQGGPFLEKV